MTIEHAIKKIWHDHFSDHFSYIFDEMNMVDAGIEKNPLPAMIHNLPESGWFTYRHGKVYDICNVGVGFVDKVVRDANGKDEAHVLNRMKAAAKEFIRLCIESGYFQDVTINGQMAYQPYYDQFSSIVTGVVVNLTITDNGEC